MWLVGERPEGKVRRFGEVFRRRGLKVNAGNTKVMVLGGKSDWNMRFA